MANFHYGKIILLIVKPPKCPISMGLCIFLGKRNIYIYKFFFNFLIFFLIVFITIYLHHKEREFKFHFQTMGYFEGQSERWHIKGPMFFFGAK